MSNFDLINLCLRASKAANQWAPHVVDVKGLYIMENFSSKEGVKGFMGIEKPNDGTTIIAFGGTDQIRDWVYNIRFGKKQRWTPQDGRKVHRGFYQQYTSIQDTVIEFIYKYQPLRLVITGHSLGGALATLFSYDIIRDGLYKGHLNCVTFGSPRVGNIRFARHYNSIMPNNIRIVNGDDLVTTLPPWWMFYKHVGLRIQIGDRHRIKFWKRITDHLEYKEVNL